MAVRQRGLGAEPSRKLSASTGRITPDLAAIPGNRISPYRAYVAVYQTLRVNYSPNTLYTFTMDFYRDVNQTAAVDGSIAFWYGAPPNLNCPPEDAQIIPGAGGTVSTSLFVNSIDRFLGSAISVIIQVGFGPPNLYFDNARLEATPRVAHSYGTVGMFAHRPGVELHDIHGVLLAQNEVTLRSGQTTSIALPVSRIARSRSSIPPRCEPAFSSTGPTDRWPRWAISIPARWASRLSTR